MVRFRRLGAAATITVWTAALGIDVAVAAPPDADLELTLAAPAAVAPGETFTVTVTVSNGGPDDVDGVFVAIDRPSGLQVTTSDQGCWLVGPTPGVLECTFSEGVPAGGEASASTTLVAPASGSIALVGTLYVDSTVPDPGSDTASVTIEVRAASTPTTTPATGVDPPATSAPTTSPRPAPGQQLPATGSSRNMGVAAATLSVVGLALVVVSRGAGDARPGRGGGGRR